MRGKDGGERVRGRKSGCLAICEEEDGEEEGGLEEGKTGMQSHLQLKAWRHGGMQTHSGAGMLN